jgi:RHS repeat-associated protein
VVEENNSGTYKQILYSPTGSKLAVMSRQNATNVFLPLPGGEQATYTNSTIRFRHFDWLGSARFESSMAELEYADQAYAPFGETYSIKGSPTTPYISFTGAQPDTISGTYDFLFRKYSPTQGRWISPDPAGLSAANISNPQSWNRYAYVLNNPLSLTDPLGLFCVWDNGSYDSNDDPNTGNKSACEDGNGGTWFNGSPSDWSPGAGDWSGQASAEFAGWAQGINPSVGDFGDPSGTADASVFGMFSPVSTITSSLPGQISGGCGVSALSLNGYLGTKNSPMVGQGTSLMNTGQKYNLDPRLLVSIAGAETSFGRNITAGQFNAFNVLYNGLNSPFSSWQSAINSVGHSLTNPSNGYNLANTATMYSRYCSTGSTCGAGLNNINTFMAQQGASVSALRYPCP